VVFLPVQPRVQVPVAVGRGRLSAVVLGGGVGRGARPGTYEVVMIQRQPSGEISGSATLKVTIGR
jgi:hypothetical protein